MSPARVRAQQRLQAFEQAHPTAARLARYASLAVRLDAGLLRRLRLQLLPASQASDEADLWFSDLSESRDGEALVLHPHVAAMLRDALAQEQLPGGRRALDIAFQLTQQAHRDWPASLQLEEELSYLALRDGDNAAPAIEHKLRPVLAALASGSARGIEIARWAKRALPRLPQVVRNSDAARAIGLATIAHIGSEGEVLAGLTDQTLPAQLAWLLPHDAVKERVTLACELGAGSLCLRAPAADDDSAMLIELPKTRPLILALQVIGGGPARLLALQVGVPVAIDSAWRQLELRCLNGETYRVERQRVAEHATAPRFDHDLFISYAHSDDQSAVEGQAGWVTHLAATLESVLATRLGRRPKIWRDRKLVDRESGPHDEETTGNLQRSALMLAVVSPHYVRSAWCLNELKVFQQAAEASGGLRVGKGFSRLIKLMKLPVDGGLPPGLQETAGYTFFEGSGSDGRAHELDPAAFDQDRLAFMKKVSHLGFELAQMLDQMSLPSAASTGVEPPEPGPEPEPAPLSVFLSHTRLDRERLSPIVRQFESAGFKVWLDDDVKSGDAWEDQIARKIEECVLFIPVISANTEARHEGFFRREWHLAVQRAARMHPDLPFIVPLCLDEIPPEKRTVPVEFRSLNWCVAPDGDLPESFAKQLALWARDERLRQRAADSHTAQAGWQARDGGARSSSSSRGSAA